MSAPSFCGCDERRRPHLETARWPFIVAILLVAVAIATGGCARPKCGFLVLAVNTGSGWEDALDRECPPTVGWVEWSQYDHESDAVIASCACYRETP